jgi:hypothetical protein
MEVQWSTSFKEVKIGRLWHVDMLLINDRKKATTQQPLLGNGPNKHERNNRTGAEEKCF